MAPINNTACRVVRHKQHVDIRAGISLLPQHCHAHVDTAVDFVNGQDINIDSDNVFMLHKIAEVLKIDALSDVTLENMKKQAATSDQVAADLLAQALSSDLPKKTMRLLMQFLPLHVVQNELIEVAQANHPPLQLVTANVVSEHLIGDKSAIELFKQSLDADVPVKDMRQLMKTLPLHEVQRELAGRIVQNEFIEARQANHAPLQLVTANVVSEHLIGDKPARELFNSSLDADVPVKDMRRLMKTLPLHVVQQELAARMAAQPPPSRL